MAVPWGQIATATGSFLSNLFNAGANKRAARYQADATKHAADQQLKGIEQQLAWEREAAAAKQKGTELENMRRSQEAMHRAAKLEDVAGMISGLSMPGAFSGGISSLGALTGAGSAAANMDFSALGNISSSLLNNPELANILASAEGLDPALLRELITEGRDVSDLRRVAGGLEDVSGLESIAQAFLSADDSADLRTSATRELSRGSDTLAALMAQQGVRGSGFAAGQQREMGASVFSNLAQQISANRRENLMAGAGVMGQAASQRGMAGQLYGQAGSQLLGAGGLAGTLGQLEQGNVALRGNLAEAMNRQSGMAADILANQYGLQLQGQGLNIQALSAAAGAEASLASTQASYELGRGRLAFDRAMGVADIYRDDAFGANLPYNPFEFAEEYDRMQREYEARKGGGMDPAVLNNFARGLPGMFFGGGGSTDMYAGGPGWTQGGGRGVPFDPGASMYAGGSSGFDFTGGNRRFV